MRNVHFLLLFSPWLLGFSCFFFSQKIYLATLALMNLCMVMRKVVPSGDYDTEGTWMLLLEPDSGAVQKQKSKMAFWWQTLTIQVLTPCQFRYFKLLLTIEKRIYEGSFSAKASKQGNILLKNRGTVQESGMSNMNWQKINRGALVV